MELTPEGPVELTPEGPVELTPKGLVELTLEGPVEFLPEGPIAMSGLMNMKCTPESNCLTISMLTHSSLTSTVTTMLLA